MAKLMGDKFPGNYKYRLASFSSSSRAQGWKIYAYMILCVWFIFLVSISVAGAEISAEKFCWYIRFLSYHKDPNIIVWVTDKVTPNVKKAPFDYPSWQMYFKKLEQQRGRDYAREQLNKYLLRFPNNEALEDYAVCALYPNFLKEKLNILQETSLPKLSDRERYLAYICFEIDKREERMKKVVNWISKHKEDKLDFYSGRILLGYCDHLMMKGDLKGAVRYIDFLINNYQDCDWVKDSVYQWLLHIVANRLKDRAREYKLSKEYCEVCPNGLLAKRAEIMLCLSKFFPSWDKIFSMWHYIDMDKVMWEEVLNALEKFTNYDADDAGSNLQLANFLYRKAPSASLEYAKRYLELTGDEKSVSLYMAEGYFQMRQYEKAYKWAKIYNPALGEIMLFTINLLEEDWDKIRPLAEDWSKKYILTKDSELREGVQTDSLTSPVWQTLSIEAGLIVWHFHNKNFDKVVGLLERSENLQKGNLVPVEELLKKINKNEQLNHEKIIDAFDKLVLDQSEISQHVLNFQRLLFIEYLKWQPQPDSELIKIISSQHFLNGLQVDFLEKLLKIAREKKLETLHQAITAFCIWGPYYYHSDFIINEITDDFIKEWQQKTSISAHP